MSTAVIEGLGNLPSQPTVIYPNRVDLSVVLELEKTLGGRIAWLVERSSLPTPDIMAHLRESKAAGILDDRNSISREMLSDRIHDKLTAGFHVVLLPPHLRQARGGLCNVSARQLARLDETTLTIVPLYVAMMNSDPANMLTDAAPYETLSLRFMPPQRPGPAQGARVRGAWMEAGADAFAQHPLVQKASLPLLLVRSLMRHQDSRIIDGVDDSPLTYRNLLALSIMLSRRLRRQTKDTRLGILLPPGKLAVIANLACLLAGITPINCNYRLGKEEFARQMQQLHLHRFLTEERFTHKLPDFNWPQQRDLVFVERELAEAGGAPFTFWRTLVRFGSVERILSRLQLPEPAPEAEATVFFSSGAEGPAKGVHVSHRMVVAGLLQLLARIDLPAGERVLTSLPLYLPAGLLHGLLLPLLAGADMVTYPTVTAARRLTELISQNKVRLALSTPALLPLMLQKGKEADFSPHLRYLIACGGRVPTRLIAEARDRLSLHVLESYSLAEAGAFVSLNLPPHDGKAAEGYSAEPELPCQRPGSAGIPLPGVAVRITDAEKEGRLMPPGTKGIIWLKGANVLTHYLDTPESVLRGQWLRTSDVGALDEDGLLTIAGRRSRFSRIGGEMVAHEFLESLLAKILKIKGNEIKIAVVGIPDPRRGEELVLLSTLHPTPRSSDLVTLKYGVMNEGFPSLWAPEKILPVPYIPLLPDGKLNYLLCRRHACRAYGVSEDDIRP